jgi:hypothetical protein
MPVIHEAQHCSALVVRLPLLLDTKHTSSTVPTLETKLFPAITLFNTEYMQMEATNRYVVWTSDHEADRFFADFIISMLDDIVFYLSGKEVKRYDRKAFIRYNPTWVNVENTE